MLTLTFSAFFWSTIIQNSNFLIAQIIKATSISNDVGTKLARILAFFKSIPGHHRALLFNQLLAIYTAIVT